MNMDNEQTTTIEQPEDTTAALTRSDNQNTALACAVPGVTFSALGIQTNRTDLTAEEFNTIFSSVLRVSRAGNWLLGDALNLADRQWGNQTTGSKYEEAASVLGLSISSIKQISLTCKAIPFARRHPELSFSHHVEARSHSNNPEVQDAVLNTASEQKQSIKAMRKCIRTQNAENVTDEQKEQNGANDDRPFGLIDLPERATPDSPPMWDALKFVAWVKKQEPETYDADQCDQALELVLPIAEYCEAVQKRQADLSDNV